MNETSEPKVTPDKPKEQGVLCSKDLLAGVSVGTIFTIKHAPDDALLVQANGPDEKAKYGGWLLVVSDGFRPLLSTKVAFDTPKAAEDFMRQVIKAAREIDLIAKPANNESTALLRSNTLVKFCHISLDPLVE